MERMKAILVLAAALAFALTPFFVTGFAGYDPQLFPVPQEDPPVQPAGWAFSIWGLIYLWLIAHAAYGLLSRAMDAEWDRPRWPLFFALCLGTAWLPVASFTPIWATVLIFAMLGLSLDVVKRAGPSDPWLLSAPLGLFAGWLTAASFASLGITLAGYGVGFGAEGWAILCVTGALVLGLVVLIFLRPHPTYGLALAWALAAITVANWNSQWDVALLAALGALATLAAMIRSYWLRATPDHPRATG